MFNYKNIYIDDWYSIIGPKEKSDGNLKKYNFNLNVLSDFAYNTSIKMQYLHIFG